MPMSGHRWSCGTGKRRGWPGVTGLAGLDGSRSVWHRVITAQGIEPAAANGSTIAITGGTGRYQSAGGEIRFRDTNPTVTVLQVVIDQ